MLSIVLDSASFESYGIQWLWVDVNVTKSPLPLFAKMIAQIYLPNENYKIGR